MNYGETHLSCPLLIGMYLGNDYHRQVLQQSATTIPFPIPTTVNNTYLDCVAKSEIPVPQRNGNTTATNLPDIPHKLLTSESDQESRPFFTRDQSFPHRPSGYITWHEMLQNRKDDTHNHSTNMQPLLMLNLKYEAVHEGWQS